MCPDAILSIANITKRFKGLTAVSDVSFDITRGSVTALIGPNGAGKTTLFNVITGFLPRDGGSIRFDGRPIEGLPAHRRPRQGLVRTFQIPRVFRRRTVLENLFVADALQPGEQFLGSIVNYGSMVRRDREAREKARELLVLLNVERLAEEYAGALSGGRRRLIELGRADDGSAHDHAR